MDGIGAAIQEWLQLSPDLQRRLVTTGLILVFLALVRILVLRLLHGADIRVRYRWRKVTTYGLGAVALLLVGRVWFDGFDSLATFLGLAAAGVAVALRDPLTNVAGWLFMLLRDPFAVGDRIQLGEHAGDVIDKRLFQFTLLEIGNWVDADQSTGRVIHVPNGKIFTEALANYSSGLPYIWNEIPVRLTFESDWRTAREILLRIAREHGQRLTAEAKAALREAAERYMIVYRHFTPAVYTSVRDFGVLLTIRYLCEPRRRRSTEQAIWEDVLDAFAERDDITFAYPTTRFFDRVRESNVVPANVITEEGGGAGPTGG